MAGRALDVAPFPPGRWWHRLCRDRAGKRKCRNEAVKKRAVTPAKLSKSAKATLTGPRGATGATGPQGPKGDRGEKANTGEPGPFPRTLPSGKSIYGAFEILGTATAANQFFGSQVSYTYLNPGQTSVYVKEGTRSTTCTGSYKTRPHRRASPACMRMPLRTPRADGGPTTRAKAAASVSRPTRLLRASYRSPAPGLRPRNDRLAGGLRAAWPFVGETSQKVSAFVPNDHHTR
jgi:hypothetical protein